MPDLPPPCEDMLSEKYRNAWCGDTDPTGRYVCRRVRDHELDRHVGRNNAGGIHEWPARPVQHAGDAPGDPVGTVRVHPDDNRFDPTARRRIAVDAPDYAGPYEGCRWQRLTGVGTWDGGCDPLHSRDVAGWPVQPLAELAVVLGHPRAKMPVDLAVVYGYELGQRDAEDGPAPAVLAADPTEEGGARPAWVQAEIDGMHLSTGGRPFAELLKPPHPVHVARAAGALIGPLQQVTAYKAAYLLHEVGLLVRNTVPVNLVQRIEEVVPGADAATELVAEVAVALDRREDWQITRWTAEVERLRGSREAWAIEADRVEQIGERILAMYDRLFTAVGEATRKPRCSSINNLDELIEAVATLRRERDEAVEALAGVS
jgi:hypothetical protein